MIINVNHVWSNPVAVMNWGDANSRLLELVSVRPEAIKSALRLFCLQKNYEMTLNTLDSINAKFTSIKKWKMHTHKQ